MFKPHQHYTGRRSIIAQICQATDPPSFLDFYVTGQTELQEKRPELDTLPGDISDAILTAGAAMAEHLSAYAENRFAATYFDTAQGDDLTALADDHLGIQRFLPNQASTTLHFHRATAGSGSGSVPASYQVNTRPDFTGAIYSFSTDTVLAFGPSQLDGYVTATAVGTGPLYDVNPGTLTVLGANLWDNSITVNNDGYAAGGTDGETDDQLRARCRLFPSTIRRGTIAALQYGATQVNGVVTDNVIEDLDPLTQEIDGIVNIYIGDQNGNSSDTMVAEVKAEEDNWRCAGIIVQVFGGTPLDLVTALGAPLIISLTIRVGQGVTVATVQDNVKAAVVARINRLNTGEALSADIVKSAALNVDPDNILAVSVNFTQIVPAQNQIIKTTTSEISVQ